MVDILAFGSHPDDVDFAAGGILARAAAQGQSVAICDLTLGEKGTNGTPDIRKKEALAAAKIIGAERTFLEFNDCEVVDSYEGRLELVRVIRHFQPKLVLAPLWEGDCNHPDHLATGQMARHACRLARFAGILPELPIHRVGGILHYCGIHQDQCDFLIDVSDHVGAWKEMIHAHKSQLKTRPYDEWCLKDGARWGIQIGARHAQRLVKGNPIQAHNLLDIAHGTVEF